MSDTTITPEKRKMFREDAAFILAHEKKKLERIGAAEAIILLLDALEQAEARAEKAEAENARLKLKCGEAAPEGTEIYPCLSPAEYVLCPTCGYEIEDPWDEPGVQASSEGWDGVLECRNCSAKIEVHHQINDFWTARLVDDEAARRAVADSEVK